ncbi:MAG: calcium/sodium antiporter [Pseudomonadales bacterium]|nr:calcium/sodium antiporter [Pseudomonadales bacterium]MBO6595854.1 calcium/sodium antiporter [Pseudomonadales bacterium]MBO6702459.1 calcium/sodium antiporter [Pseudomonadales bacterium]MBO6822338.1 calcium/sodium antiporter [Pseudomonadales bacterium]MBO7005853.1 calcium/sodium antiporter [Pseudomonadales bacterium]
MLSFLLLVVGLVLLLAGGAALVRGASGIAESYGVSPLVVGLTVVAFGTSSPELVVNIIGALRGETDIAFGNIAGSNLANLGLVLGSAALITPIAIQSQIIRRELPLLLLATIMLMVMTLDSFLRGFNPILDRSDGLILLLTFGIFVYIMVLDFMRQQADPLLASIDTLSPELSQSSAKDWCFVIGGIAGLGMGGEMSITNGIELAEILGVTTTVVGIAVIAIGTSLPELVTSIIAAMRKEADLCVGNVIGSNIFNTLMVLPVSALVYPLSIPSGGTTDIIVTFFFAAALIPVFIFRNKIMSRLSGGIFVAAYLGYMIFRVSTSSPA